MALRVAIVSDTHLTPRTAAYAQNWTAVATWIETTTPALVVHLGDITANGVTDPGELDAAAAVFAGITRPMRFLPGNHDIGDNPLETNHSPDHPLDLERLAHYRRAFGPDRWVLELDAWTLIGLDAQLFGTGTEEERAQLAWLDHQLSPARGPVGVLLHKPLFRDGPHETEVHVRYVPAPRDTAC
jgi:3',5'-cyclic AMP phosphodiesterase CpdA